MSPNTDAVIESGSLRVKRARHGLMAYLIGDRYVGRSFDRYGEFSEAEVELFRQIVRPGAVVVDGGANIGAHSVALARIVGPKGAVIAVEPQRIIHQLLCTNLALNGIANVRALNAALGRAPGRIAIPSVDYDGEGNFGGLALGGDAKGEAVCVLTLDSLELSACQLIKLDVEGMEGEALAGAARTIERHRPILYVENDRKDRSEALLGAMFERGYRLYWHTPPLFNPNNFFGQTKNLFGNIVSVNVLALPKEREQDLRLREIRSADERRDAGRPGADAGPSR